MALIRAGDREIGLLIGHGKVHGAMTVFKALALFGFMNEIWRDLA
jgi:hypothetical protein